MPGSLDFSYSSGNGENFSLTDEDVAFILASEFPPSINKKDIALTNEVVVQVIQPFVEETPQLPVVIQEEPVHAQENPVLSQEEPAPGPSSTFSCRCLMCYKEFSMMSLLNAHLVADHSALIGVVSPDLFLKAAKAPIDQATYIDLQLKDIFQQVTNHIEKSQKDEIRSKYSSVDYCSQLICKIKHHQLQIENTKKELNKYGDYTSEFPVDLFDQVQLKEAVTVRVNEDFSVTQIKSRPATAPVPMPVPVTVPVPALVTVPAPALVTVPVTIPAPAPVLTPVPAPITTKITIINHKEDSHDFITDEKNTYYECVTCKNHLHTLKSCKVHICSGIHLYCAKCNTQFDRLKAFNKHLVETNVVRVPECIIECINFDVTPVTSRWFNSINDIADYFREPWKLISKLDQNKCIRKVKHVYQVHRGCKKWHPQEIKTLKWQIVYSLSKLLQPHEPRFFSRIISRIEECYHTNGSWSCLEKDFCEFTSGWWILPKNKPVKPKKEKPKKEKAADSKTVTVEAEAKAPVVTQVKAKKEKAGGSKAVKVEAEIKTPVATQLKAKKEKPAKPSNEQTGVEEVAVKPTPTRKKPALAKEVPEPIVNPITGHITYNERTFSKSKNSYRCLHCAMVLRSLKGCLGHGC